MKKCNLINELKQMLNALALEVPSEVHQDISTKIELKINEIEKLRSIIIENRKALVKSGSISIEEIESWI